MVELLLLLCVGAILSLLGSFLSAVLGRLLAPGLVDFVRKSELRLQEMGLRREGDLWVGTLHGHPVELHGAYVSGDAGPTGGQQWRVSVPSGSLSLDRTSVETQDLSLGDPRFDPQFTVRGEPMDLALLTPRVRELLLAMPVVRIEAGQLCAPSWAFDPQSLQRLLALADELRRIPVEPAERMRLAVDDPLPAVRIFYLLMATELDLGLGRQLAERLRGDRDRTVRARALSLLEEGWLEDTASLQGPMEQRRWAIRLLRRHGTEPQRLRAGRTLLGSPEPSLRDEGLSLLRLVGPASEPVLVDLLPELDGELLGEALQVLGEVGTVASVPALRARQESLSLLQGGLSRAVDQAVMAIQARAGAERGGLAVAGAPAAQGALSMAAERGRLSARERT